MSGFCLIWSGFCPESNRPHCLFAAANYASFSPGYALELEKKLAARDAEVAALREQLEAAKAELAAVQRGADAQANAELAAEEHVLGPEEHVRRRAEHAL